jgi:peptidoglycan/LPS O-acetylase OafA/YrhL
MYRSCETGPVLDTPQVRDFDRAADPAPLHLPAFDGLRAIAALLVVCVHVSFVTGLTNSRIGDFTARAEIGVSVFFLISGFLLYRPFTVAHFADRPQPSTWRFYLRRLLRIVPLYWVALTVVVLASSPRPHGIRELTALYFFGQIYSRFYALDGISQAWSLCIEMVFYLVLPGYAVLLARRGRTASRQLTVEVAGLVVLYVGAVAFRAAMLTSAAPPATWHAWLPNWLDLFALGMLLAVLHSWYAQRGRSPRWADLPGFAAVCWIGAAVVYTLLATAIGLGRDPLFVGSPRTEMLRQALSGVFALLLMLPAVFGPARTGVVRRLLSSRELTLVGLVSYGIYLWHQFVISRIVDWFGLREGAIPFLPFTLGLLAIVIALAALSYFAVERPFVARGREWTRRERQAGLKNSAAG